MSKKKVIENDSMSLWYHPESKIVHHKIHKFSDEGIFREVLSRGADYMEKHNAIKWLSDDLDSPVVRKEDAEWGDKVWAPRVIKAGFKYWAIVQPKKAIGSMQMKMFAEQYGERGVTVKLFDNVDDALAWLESLD
jgi:hypothetical protein